MINGSLFPIQMWYFSQYCLVDIFSESPIPGLLSKSFIISIRAPCQLSSFQHPTTYLHRAFLPGRNFNPLLWLPFQSCRAMDGLSSSCSTPESHQPHARFSFRCKAALIPVPSRDHLALISQGRQCLTVVHSSALSLVCPCLRL